MVFYFIYQTANFLCRVVHGTFFSPFSTLCIFSKVRPHEGLQKGVTSAPYKGPCLALSRWEGSFFLGRHSLKIWPGKIWTATTLLLSGSATFLFYFISEGSVYLSDCMASDRLASLLSHESAHLCFSTVTASADGSEAERNRTLINSFFHK